MSVRSLSSFFNPCVSQVPLVAVDSFFYGKLVVAPLNILLYNVFTPHGPDLYGNTQEHTCHHEALFKVFSLSFFPIIKLYTFSIPLSGNAPHSSQ